MVCTDQIPFLQRKPTPSHLMNLHTAATVIQRGFHRFQLISAPQRQQAATKIQQWIRRTARRLLFTNCARALYFQPNTRWEGWSISAATAIASTISMPGGLNLPPNFVLNCIYKYFPGVDSPYNILPRSAVRARIYSFTSEQLSALIIEWYNGGVYSLETSQKLLHLSAILLDRAISFASSIYSAYIQADLKWAQHWFDKASQLLERQSN